MSHGRNKASGVTLVKMFLGWCHWNPVTIFYKSLSCNMSSCATLYVSPTSNLVKLSLPNILTECCEFMMIRDYVNYAYNYCQPIRS